MDSKVHSFQSEKSLSIVQLSTPDQNSFKYISGAKAIKDNLIEVKELSESGIVNSLIVINLSNEFVFFMDGDILVGAKQNRVLNTSVLLAPKSKITIPVSCVEQGRWRYKSAKFSEAYYSSPAYLRASKAKSVKSSLKMSNQYNADQREVWERVELYSKGHNVNSATSNLSDIYDEKMDDLDEFTEAFKLSNEANGMAVFIQSKLLNIDVFNRTDIYAEYFPKIIKGAAMEAFGLKITSELKEAEAVYKAQSFLDKFDTMEFEKYNGVGVGTERRFESNELTGFKLVYSGKLIHLTALNIKDERETSNEDIGRNRV